MVAKYIPFLRRYARALAGTQAAGDACVTATLQALVEHPAPVDTEHLRVELFRLFTRTWGSVPDDASAKSNRLQPLSEQWLANLTPLSRQAFLLMSLEGFSETEATLVLECDVKTLRRLVDEAGRELASEIATDVLIIEDEVLIAVDLGALVESLGHRVIGIARTHAEAIKYARTRWPGLILADIQLADGSSGLDAVNELLRSFETPAIFITAYPERFLTGERPEPAFLISKPFQPALVSAIVSQALFFERNARQREPRVALRAATPLRPA